MKTVLQVFVPAFVPFPIMAWLGKLLISYDDKAASLSEVTFSSLKSFLSVAMPLLFIVAVLLQILMVMQFKNILQVRYAYKRFILIVTAVAILLSYTVAYIIWEPQLGVSSLLRSVGVMTTVQAIYWLLNISTIHIIDRIYNQHIIKAE
jgi:hypothetical protein